MGPSGRRAHAAAALLKARSNAGHVRRGGATTTSTSPEEALQVRRVIGDRLRPGRDRRARQREDAREAALEELRGRGGCARPPELRERDEAGRPSSAGCASSAATSAGSSAAPCCEALRRRHRGVVLRGLVAGLKERRRERGGERRVDEREASGRLAGGFASSEGGGRQPPARAPSGRRAPARSGGAAARWREGFDGGLARGDPA